MTAERVLTMDVSSGRVHARYRVGRQWLTDEADNLDDAGDFVELADLEGIPPEDLCKRCFAPTEDADLPDHVPDGEVE